MQIKKNPTTLKKGRISGKQIISGIGDSAGVISLKQCIDERGQSGIAGNYNEQAERQ